MYSKDKYYVIIMLTIPHLPTMGIERKITKGSCPKGLQAFKTLQRCTIVSTPKDGMSRHTLVPE